jgi:WD40 repeat protein
LLSTSVDRGVIVWKQGEGNNKYDFSPQLGMIKEKIANLDAAWNHRGDKFCVGSSSGFLYVGFYNPNNNFWVAYPTQKKPSHKASVTSVRFDNMTGRVIVSGSLDGTV